MNKQIVIFGASGHGKVVADIAKKNGYVDIIFLDDNEAVEKCGSYAVAGTSKDAASFRGSDFVVAIGNSRVREMLWERLHESGLCGVSLVHPNAVIGEDVEIGTGTVIMAGAVVNSGTKIGKGCIINTCASVDHDCLLGAYVHISIGAHVAGTAEIGAHTWIGAGATVSNNLKIAGDCMIGAGAVVVKELSEAATYVGVPARKMDMK